MAMMTRLYLIGFSVAAALCATAIAFPQAPPTLMLGLLGGTFWALAARTHRYAQAQQAKGGGEGRLSHPIGRVRTAGLESPTIREHARDLAATIP